MNMASRIISLLVLSFIINVPLMASVEQVYDDYIKVIKERSHKVITENDIIEARMCLHIRNNYDAIIIPIVDLILTKEINAGNLELVWWRAKDSRIRMFVLIAYYKKYGNKRVDVITAFEDLTSEFSDENKRARLKEIVEVYRLLYPKSARFKEIKEMYQLLYPTEKTEETR